MNKLRKAAEMALPLLVAYRDYTGDSRIANECGETIEALRTALAQPEQEKESTAQTVDPRLLLGRSNNFTKETENRLCDIERRLAAIETQPALAQPEQEPTTTIETVCALLRQAHDVLSLSSLPPKRQWVSLTDEDMGFLFPYGKSVWVQETVKIIEAALRSKNNG